MAPIIGKLLTSFASIALRSHVRDDDVIDQLNHWATTGLLTALALGTAAKQYVGDPIHCWVPAEYKKKHYQKYFDSYCWIHPMYSIPLDDPIHFDPKDRWFNDVGYYRWVFIVFLTQAFLFKFPNLLWQELKNYSGLNVSKIVGMAWDTHMLTQDKRDEKMSHMAIYIDCWLKTYSQYKYTVLTRFRDCFSRIMFCFGKRSGTYLIGLYMLTKLMYFTNVIGQFFLLSAFLDINYWTFGLKAMKTLNKQGSWQDHYVFPRVALCDYKIRQQTNIQTFTFQCVLSLNLFLEKMYLILWFWLVMLLVFNFINLGQWLFRGLQPHSGQSFLQSNLLLQGIDCRKDRKLFVKFVRHYLRTDGVFMLRIVATNTSEMLTLDLVKHLWQRFKDTHGMKDDYDLNNETRDSGPDVAHPSAPVVEEDEEDLPAKKLY